MGLGVCVCVCMYYGFRCVCVCVMGLGVCVCYGLRYTCMCGYKYMETRKRSFGNPALSLSTYSFETESLTELGARLGGQEDAVVLQFPQPWGYRPAQPYLAFHMGAEDFW
jgi:hypothetical protein